MISYRDRNPVKVCLSFLPNCFYSCHNSSKIVSIIASVSFYMFRHPRQYSFHILFYSLHLAIHAQQAYWLKIIHICIISIAREVWY